MHNGIRSFNSTQHSFPTNCLKPSKALKPIRNLNEPQIPSFAIELVENKQKQQQHDMLRKGGSNTHRGSSEAYLFSNHVKMQKEEFYS